MSALRISIVSMLCLVALAGCTLSRWTVGDPLVEGAEAELYAGQTQAEVLDRLGPPARVDVVWGETVFEYFYRVRADRELEVSLFRASFEYEEERSQADRLVVRFDLAGRVRDFGIGLQTPRAD